MPELVVCVHKFGGLVVCMGPVVTPEREGERGMADGKQLPAGPDLSCTVRVTAGGVSLQQVGMTGWRSHAAAPGSDFESG